MSLIPFAFEGAPVRVVDRSGDTWFILSEICKILEISNPSDAAKRLEDDEKMSVGRGTLGLAEGAQMTIINEPGMYRLVMRSDKPIAKRFQKWVVSEVLPSIRKNGGYQIVPQKQLTQLEALKQAVAGWEEAEARALTYQGQAETAQAQVEKMTPAVEAFDRIATAGGSLCITDAAKTLQMQPQKLFAWMREHRWIYKRLGSAVDVAYQDKIQQGLLEHKITTVLRSDGTEKTVTQVRVTPKGLAKLAKEFCQQDKAA